jgi:hypothetical protein
VNLVQRAAVAAASVVLVAAAPASALPPMSLTGNGYIAPGLDGQLRPEVFLFVGTSSLLPAGPSYACRFEGTGYGTTGHVAGTMSGSCGPRVFSGCAFDATPAVFTIACPNAAGTLAVSGFNGIAFSASGVLA